MDSLQQFSRYRVRIEWELRTVASTRDRSRPKRQRIQPPDKISRFEDNMLRLKSKWTQMIENVFLKIDYQDIYDKMAADLTKSFLDINATCEFEGDQLDYALRCAVLPVAALLMSEQEDGCKGCSRQSRRVYFLRKLLYGMIIVYPEGPSTNSQAPESTSLAAMQILAHSPDSLSPNDVQVVSQLHERGTQRDRESNSPNQDARCGEAMQFYPPTLISITVLNILFEAVEKHSQNMSRYSRFARALESRIFQIVNIAHVVDILNGYLADIISYLGIGTIETQTSETRLKYLSALRDPVAEYEKKLHASLDMIEKSQKLTQFKKQVDSLLYQVKFIRAKLNK